jgi:hypothetical protein
MENYGKNPSNSLLWGGPFTSIYCISHEISPFIPIDDLAMENG